MDPEVSHVTYRLSVNFVDHRTKGFVEYENICSSHISVETPFDTPDYLSVSTLMNNTY